jgi:hypothetical protein
MNHTEPEHVFFEHIPIPQPSSTVATGGKLCNNIIRNIVCSVIAKKHDLKFIYDFHKKTAELGIELYTDGTKMYTQTVAIKDEDFFKLLEQETLDHNLNVYDVYFQNQEIANFIRQQLSEPSQKLQIINKNIYRHRYEENNDIFVHVRLNDAAQYNPGFEYYDLVLSDLPFEQGYISSDNIDHPLCKLLIEKHGLVPIQMDEVHTIMLASTCKYLLLSAGTFSWMIGVLGWFSTVFYPDPELKTKWHGDIFGFSDWNKINIRDK